MRKFSVSHCLYFVATGVGIGGFFIANSTVKSLSTSAWTAVFLGLVACALPIFAVCIAKKIGGMGEVRELMLKNTRSALVLKIIYSIFFFVASVFLCAHFTRVINQWILPDVSKILIAAGLCSVLFLSLYKKRSAVFYAAVIIGGVCVFAVLAIRGLIVFGGENVKLFPLFEMQRIGRGLVLPFLSCFGVFSTAALIAFVYSKKSNMLSWSAALILSGVIFFLIISSCIVLIGAELTAESADAMALAMRRSDLFGRGDILYFIWWMFFIIITFISVGYAPKAALGGGEHSGASRFIYSAAVLVLSLALGRAEKLVTYMVYYFSAGGGGLLYITALHFISAAKNKGKESINEA